MNLIEFFTKPEFQRKYELMYESIAEAERNVMSELYTLFGGVSTIIDTLSKSYNILPYHNLQHAFLVASNSINLYNKATTPDVGSHERKTLLMAALFHDAGHSGGAKTDSENIYTACAILAKFSKDNPHINFNLGEACLAIHKTEYVDSGFPHSPSNLIQDVLRDADLLASFTSSNHPQQLLGLKQEMGLECTDLELIEQNVNFIKGALFYTYHGQAKANEYIGQAEAVLNCKRKE